MNKIKVAVLLILQIMLFASLASSKSGCPVDQVTSATPIYIDHAAREPFPEDWNFWNCTWTTGKVSGRYTYTKITKKGGNYFYIWLEPTPGFNGEYPNTGYIKRNDCYEVTITFKSSTDILYRISILDKGGLERVAGTSWMDAPTFATSSKWKFKDISTVMNAVGSAYSSYRIKIEFYTRSGASSIGIKRLSMERWRY